MEESALSLSKRPMLLLRALLIGLAALSCGAAARADIAPAAPVAPGVGSAADNPIVKKNLADAQKAFASGDVRLATILLKNAVAAAPRDGALRARLGSLLLVAGDPVSAERELRQARADGAPDQFVLPYLFGSMLARNEEQNLLNEFADPGPNAQGGTSADILKGRALAFQALGNFNDANAAMDHSLKLRRDMLGLVTRARLAAQQNNFTAAKTFSDEAIKLDPKAVDPMVFRLGLLMATNDFIGALAQANQILQSYPTNMTARVGRIEVLLKLRKDAEARADIDAILAKSPTMPLALYFKSVVLAHSHDFKGAWRIAQSLPPELVQSQPSIALMTSEIAVANGNVDTGAAILTGALTKSPELVDLRVRLAMIRLQQNSPEAALSTLLPAKDSTDPRIQALIAQAYLKLKQYSNALDTLNRLDASGTGGVNVKREMAFIEMQAGQREQAIKDLIELAAKHPTDPTVVAPLIAALVQAKRFGEALSIADRLGSDPKQRGQALFFRGQILVLQGDTNAGLAAFQQTLQLEPKNVAALYYRANLLETLQRYGEADRDLQTLLKIDPKNVSALVKRAEVAARQNQDSSVRALLAQAMSLAPKDPSPRMALIKYLVLRHDMKGALAAATDFAKILPNNADAVKLLGDVQLTLGQKGAALASYRRLSSLVPKTAAPQILLANALFMNGDRTGAATALNNAVTFEPDSLDARSAQVDLMLKTNNVGGAIAAARAYQTSHPGTEADLLLANALASAKEYSEASAVLSRSLAQRPNSKVVVLLAHFAALTGDKKRGESLLSDWLDGHASDLEVRAQYGMHLMEDGNKPQAMAQFEMVLKKDPNNVIALNNLGWLLQKDDPQRGLALVQRAAKLAPSSADVVDTLGWLQFQLKDTKNAVETLKRAHAMRPRDGEITYHLVLALDGSGNRNAARGLLKALLDSGVKFDDIVAALRLADSWH